MTKLQINESDKKILEQILSKYPYQFYAYGSRVKGTARKYSDLDLCLQLPRKHAFLSSSWNKRRTWRI